MIGQRIKQARLAAGLTLDQVAASFTRVGQQITKAAVSNYEKGKRTPSASTLTLIAKALKVRPAQLLVPQSVSIEWAAYRCQTRLTKRKKESIRAFAESIAERQMCLQSLLFPNERAPLPRQTVVRTRQQAEDAAVKLRQFWRLGDAPIESLTQTVEGKAGIVVEYEMKQALFDGLSGTVNGIYPILVVNESVSDDRRRFDLAHELGHLTMDCGALPAKDCEELAHNFAGAFLVPASVVRRELGDHRRSISIDELGMLKQKFGMSMGAWLYRAMHLGIITESYFRRMRILFSQRGWKRTEPVAFHGNERPNRLRQMVLRALEEGIVTPARAEELCPSCLEADKLERSGLLPVAASASQLMRLPRSERQAILAAASELARKDYDDNPELAGFEAYGEDDLND